MKNYLFTVKSSNGFICNCVGIGDNLDRATQDMFHRICSFSAEIIKIKKI